MKALVLGGTRYFGKRLAQDLANAGWELFVLSRGEAELPRGARHLRADRRDVRSLRAVLGVERFDVVFDQVCYTAGDVRIANEVFADRTSNYVFTSSASVYRGGFALSEKDFEPARHVFDAEVDEKRDYAEAKRQSEAEFERSPFARRISVRFPIVLGPDDYTKRLWGLIEAVRNEKPIYFPDLKARMSYIHAADAARTLRQCAEKGLTGPLNAASTEPLSMADLVRQVEDVTGRRARLLSNESKEHWSPFGVLGDWSLDVSRAEREGLSFKSLPDWLPTLIRELNGEMSR